MNNSRNTVVEQVCEKLKQVRDDLVGDAGEFVVTVGLYGTAIRGVQVNEETREGTELTEELAPLSIYAVIQIPLTTNIEAGIYRLEEGGQLL